MKQLFILALLLFTVKASFAQTNQIKTEEFILKTDTQTAHFNIGTGWVGGGASMPVLNLDNYRPLKLNGMDIYFDASYSEQVRKKLPSCYKGTPDIVVKAKIYLKEKTVYQSTNPPLARTIYEAVVVELYDISVKTEECDK